jgi:hypothetical protein
MGRGAVSRIILRHINAAIDSCWLGNNRPMKTLKARGFAVVIILAFAGMMYYNWHQLLNEGIYSMKFAAFGPVGVVGGLFLFIFPGKGGKPETARDKVIALVVFGAGLLAGLCNWYLMDPEFFGR